MYIIGQRKDITIMKTTPVKGTADYLPQEVRIRDYLQSTILKTYTQCGFERITTPIIEDIENLDKSDGGENLNLIFKIMKRGEKLDEAVASGDTLPLTRYYANNRAKLQLPFKVIQLDRVYRAERPQKGRMREFVQCDIDIIGSDSYTAEVELINTTAKALKNIGFDNFNIHINDRRLLKAVITGAGFDESDCDSVCISLDKLDKMDAAAVSAELVEKGFSAELAERLMNELGGSGLTLDRAEELCGEQDFISNLRRIIDISNSLADGYQIVYDPTLVRGQGYYTGTVFEIRSSEFRGALGGGGRYDNLIGKFLGESTPAVGFSIGFERIAGILLERGYKIPTARERAAIIYTEDNFADAMKLAGQLRDKYDTALFAQPKKLGKLLGRLEESGYKCYVNMSDPEPCEHILGQRD